jgi:DnaB-like helicase C terminal domain
LNLSSALFYRVLEVKDFDTWNNVRRHYLPTEYHSLFDVIEKHIEKYHKLPTLEELKLEVRDGPTVDKIYALEDADIEVEPYLLLEYIKNEYAQKEALSQLDKWVDGSMAFETAEEVVRHIQQIGTDLETKVELTPSEETMQKISLFDSEDDMEARIKLGFNEDFDSRFNFKPTDYIMMGGQRGAGKSVTGSNIARNVINQQKKKVLYFSVEMPVREILQRDAAIATGIPFFKIRDKNMSMGEWELLAKWWSDRYIEGEGVYEDYLKHRSFDKFHASVSRHDLVSHHLDIIYDSNLTLGRMNAEVDKRLNAGEEIGLIVADYVQVVKRVANHNFSINHIDWQEQIQVSRGFKNIAETRQVPVYSPYQIDATGEARFSKGILDSCDAAFTLKAHKGDNPCIEFATTKMRGADDTEVFVSQMNWGSLRIGPKSVEAPIAISEKKGKTSFSSGEMSVKTSNVYDD